MAISKSNGSGVVLAIDQGTTSSRAILFGPEPVDYGRCANGNLPSIFQNPAG